MVGFLGDLVLVHEEAVHLDRVGGFDVDGAAVRAHGELAGGDGDHVHPASGFDDLGTGGGGFPGRLLAASQECYRQGRRRQASEMHDWSGELRLGEVEGAAGLPAGGLAEHSAGLPPDFAGDEGLLGGVPALGGGRFEEADDQAVVTAAKVVLGSGGAADVQVTAGETIPLAFAQEHFHGLGFLLHGLEGRGVDMLGLGLGQGEQPAQFGRVILQLGMGLGLRAEVSVQARRSGPATA